jgi:hypothetical protein
MRPTLDWEATVTVERPRREPPTSSVVPAAETGQRLTQSSSTSKISAASGGMTPPAPRLPYAMFEE